MEDEVLSCDVLIVGGGPAGLAVASTLPGEVSSIVVHQDREIGLPVRSSGACWLDDARRLGLPAEHYRPVQRSEAWSDNAQAVLPIRKNPMVVLSTPGLYRWLASLSDDKPRRLMTATKFTAIRALPDGRWESTVRPRGGAQRRVVSRYVVDASGWHMAVLEALGLAKRPARRGVGIEYEFPIGGNDPDRTLVFMGRSVPAGYGWAFPTAQDTIRLGVGVIQPDTDASPRALIDALMRDTAALARMGLTLEGTPEVHGGILPAVAYEPELVFGSVVRVGDSANFATPTVGEGIRVCIEHGRSLGLALGRAAQGGGARPLKRWQRRVRRRLGRDYRLGFAANKRISRYGPAEWDRSVRRMGQVNEAAAAALFRSEFGPGRLASMALVAGRAWVRSRLRRFSARR